MTTARAIKQGPDRIRLAGEQDAAAMLDIYAPLVRDSAVSFEVEPPSVADYARRIRETLEHWPWLVCAAEQAIVGFAYADRHRRRGAYRWSVEVSVYVHGAHHRRGVGERLYLALFELLRKLGYSTALAGIALPNPASVAFHEALGFQAVGVYRRIGHKLGAWHDVGWWQLMLGNTEQAPAEPRSMSDILPLPDLVFE